MKGALCIALTGLTIGGMFLASPYRRQTELAQAQAAPCRQADIYNAVTMRGKTETLRKSRAYAPWTATVKELYVRQGDQVAQGDPLALLKRPKGSWTRRRQTKSPRPLPPLLRRSRRQSSR